MSCLSQLFFELVWSLGLVTAVARKELDFVSCGVMLRGCTSELVSWSSCVLSVLERVFLFFARLLRSVLTVAVLFSVRRRDDCAPSCAARSQDRVLSSLSKDIACVFSGLSNLPNKKKEAKQDGGDG